MNSSCYISSKAAKEGLLTWQCGILLQYAAHRRPVSQPTVRRAPATVPVRLAGVVPEPRTVGCCSMQGGCHGNSGLLYVCSASTSFNLRSSQQAVLSP